MKDSTIHPAGGGSYYELAIKLGAHSDGRLLAAAAQLWQTADLDGPYEHSDIASCSHDSFAIEDPQRLTRAHYGVATTPCGRCICASVAVRGEPDDGTVGVDWLDLMLYTGALCDMVGAVFPIDDPVNDRWREPLDAWFADIARQIFAAVPFEIALIGEEVSGTDLDVVWHAAHGRRPFGYVTPSDYFPAWRSQ